MVSIIAVGNPGVGKSTILNSLAEELIFESGTSFGGGLTYQLDEKITKNGTRFYDTPGLSDRKLREAAGRAITQALRKGGDYKILFFVRSQFGRVVGEDITTFKLVLDSAPEIGNDYGIVINMISRKMANNFLSDPKKKDAFLTEIFSNLDPQRQCDLSNIAFLPHNVDVEDEDNKLIPLIDLKTIDGTHFKSHVTQNMSSVRLTKDKAEDIAISNFDDAKEEIERLKKEMKENQKMFEMKQKEMKENQKMLEMKHNDLKENHIIEIAIKEGNVLFHIAKNSDLKSQVGWENKRRPLILIFNNETDTPVKIHEWVFLSGKSISSITTEKFVRNHGLAYLCEADSSWFTGVSATFLVQVGNSKMYVYTSHPYAGCSKIQYGTTPTIAYDYAKDGNPKECKMGDLTMYMTKQLVPQDLGNSSTQAFAINFK